MRINREDREEQQRKVKCLKSTRKFLKKVYFFVAPPPQSYKTTANAVIFDGSKF
jgi:hypothetical protein